MLPQLSRRQCVSLLPLTAATILTHQLSPTSPLSPPATSPATLPSTVPDSFPAHDISLVREFVGASHSRPQRVAELLKSAPQLANATYDWGFGDWETALGAASHTGQTEIALLLLQHGARPDIFSATMLGQLPTVQAMILAQPGLQKTRGPHGITLLAHARASGPTALPVLEYLTALGQADIPYPEQPLSPDQFPSYLGTYAYGPAEHQRFTISSRANPARLTFKRNMHSCNLFHLGNHTFHPAGAPDVHLTFTLTQNLTSQISITTPTPLLTAARI